MKAKEVVAQEVARQKEFGYEPSWEDFVIAGQQAGIREVAEWGDEVCHKHQPSIPVVVDGIKQTLESGTFKRRNCDRCWQTKLKELGIVSKA